jgi:hypothetical protein
MRKNKSWILLFGLLLPFCASNSPAPYSRIDPSFYSSEVSLNPLTGEAVASIANLSDSELDVSFLAVVFSDSTETSSGTSCYLDFPFGKIPAKTTSFWSLASLQDYSSYRSLDFSKLTISQQELLGNVYDDCEYVVDQDYSYSGVSVLSTNETINGVTYSDFTFEAENFVASSRDYTRFFSFDYEGARRSTLASGGDVLSLEGSIDKGAFTNLECRVEKRDTKYYRNKRWNRLVAIALTMAGIFGLAVLGVFVWLIVYLTKNKKQNPK